MIEEYGNGESTGLEQTPAGKIQTGFTLEDVKVSREDKAILRELAEKVKKLASEPCMEEKRQLWKKHNMLQKTRPLVFCDPENGWNEIITRRQMRCKGRLAQRWEMDLRKEIFWGEDMGDDKPVEPYLDVPYTVSPDNWGVMLVYYQTDKLGSYTWDPPVKDYKTDLKKLHPPEFEIDWETTNGCLDLAEDIFGDMLRVNLKGVWWWSLGITSLAIYFRGIENFFCDFIEHPEELKQLFSIISQGYLQKLDFLEENNLLSLNNDGSYVGAGGFGFTQELPQKDFNGHVRTVDMWGFAESQETVNVSAKMYEEFVFPYEKIILERFGLNCYGCCEPLHSRWYVVKKHHNLRRVSCSPWVDIEKMVSYLENKYIFSMKPHPAILAKPFIDEEYIRKQIRKAFEVTRECRVEIIMKDNHTIGKNPKNVVKWCQIAREEAERYS